jgi:hypothetical protein
MTVKDISRDAFFFVDVRAISAWNLYCVYSECSVLRGKCCISVLLFHKV